MESSSFECITCKLNITGFTNFQRHVNSVEHANNVRMKISNNVTDEEKVLTSAECEEPTSSQYSPPSFSSVGLACELCQKRFSGNEPYQQHLASAGHKKKVESLNNPNGSMGQLRCDICDKDFSGKVPYEQHIASKVHLKKALLTDMKEKSFTTFLAEHQIGGKNNYIYPMGNDSSNSKVNGSSVNDSFPKPVTTEVTIPASVVASQMLLGCDVCDKRFSGPVPYQQHMDSQIHKKKEQEKEMLKRIHSSSNRCEVDSGSSHGKIDEINNSGIGSLEKDLIKSPLSATSQIHPFRCADCDKSFNGLVPYDQHMKSAIHLKKMLQKKPMNEETDYERKFPVTSTPKSEIPNYERYYCKICDKQCTGSIPFTQHNFSEAHCKKLQVHKFNQELNNLSQPKDSNLDDDQMSTDDNYAIELSKKSSLFSSSSELSFNDILKEVNHVTPDTLNVATFGVGDSIVF